MQTSKDEEKKRCNSKTEGRKILTQGTVAHAFLNHTYLPTLCLIPDLVKDSKDKTRNKINTNINTNIILSFFSERIQQRKLNGSNQIN